MAKHLHLYMNNPTADGGDGTQISDNDETMPLSVTLNASQAESKAVKVAARCDSGFAVEGDTEIYFNGTNTDKWQVAPDSDFPDAETALTMAQWASTLTIADVAAKNKIFWVKATSSADEDPQNDKSVDLIAEGLVVAVN